MGIQYNSSGDLQVHGNTVQQLRRSAGSWEYSTTAQEICRFMGILYNSSGDLQVHGNTVQQLRRSAGSWEYSTTAQEICRFMGILYNSSGDLQVHGNTVQQLRRSAGSWEYCTTAQEICRFMGILYNNLGDLNVCGLQYNSSGDLQVNGNTVEQLRRPAGKRKQVWNGPSQKKGSRKTTNVTQTPRGVPPADKELYPGCGERTPAADVPVVHGNTGLSQSSSTISMLSTPPVGTVVHVCHNKPCAENQTVASVLSVTARCSCSA
ncbi:UNVERIFIED_CONTAM: hypothetical protein FKN15_045553 [Acipenser sinensis]